MPPGLERERGKRKKGAVSDSEVPSFGLQGGQFPLKAGAVLASSLLPVLWYYKINGKGYVFLAPLWAASFPAPGGLGPGVTGRLSFPAAEAPAQLPWTEILSVSREKDKVPSFG